MEKFLQQYHAENIAEGVLDDEMSDHFDNWVAELSNEELIKLADKYVEPFKEKAWRYDDLNK